MASAASYNIASNREDLMQGFKMLEPENTPILSSARKGRRAKSAFPEWVVDSLADVSLEAVAEGTDQNTFDNPGEDRTRLGNRPQQQRTQWQVSDLEMLVDDAATENQIATAKAKKLSELKRNIESVIGSDQEMSASNAATLKMRALGKWIDSSAQAVEPVPEAFRPASGQINSTATASLTEDDVNDVLQAIWTATGDISNYKLFCGGNLKRAFSNFTRVQPANSVLRVNTDSGDKSLSMNILRYEGDFGSLDLIPDLFLAKDGTADVSAARGYLIDPSLLEISFMDGPSHHELEDKGGGPRGFYKAWYTLCVKNPKGLGKFAATS